ncbi:hypothetical protein HXX76_008160 [Chlamydomonas incerta]|uniref:Uncharacterized protein n=1 Tax=Chlamydomonas incerta TaxID=51695 RepID=A0A835SYH6_CHLIN|nr:hypothetical protein HXX76_008160 [Chlamydomonas incerta]|eukprot:KAG2433802.1 hypothetical protein HXX76_008160 [Chlamydomonas incerta]
MQPHLLHAIKLQRLWPAGSAALAAGRLVCGGTVCAAASTSSNALGCGGSAAGLLLGAGGGGGIRPFSSSLPAREASNASGARSSSSGTRGSRQEEPEDRSPMPPAGGWPPQPATGGLRDDPGHELATGGLYESARKDREAVPSPWPGTTKEEIHGDGRPSAQQVTQDSGGGAGDLPASSYPIHDDPATSTQHPEEAFRSPAAEGAPDRAQPRDSQLPSADRRSQQSGPSPPHGNVTASTGPTGVAREPPPDQDVQRGQVGAVRPAGKEQQGSEVEGFVRAAAGDNLQEPSRGKLDEGAEWAQSNRH